jgi:dicarboxylate/amino acid:cation (Na+ or H+) symporter, DAACS family
MTAPAAAESKLHRYILYSLVFGAVAGSIVNALLPVDPRGGLGILAGGYAPSLIDPTPGWLTFLLAYIFDPLGQLFLRLLFMTVVPLVFCSLAVGVAHLGDMGKLGRIGAKTFGYFLITSTSAVVIGLVLVNTIRPGRGLPDDALTQLQATYGLQASERLARPAEFGIETFLNIVPRNPIRAAARWTCSR